MDSSLRVTALQYIITGGELIEEVTGESLKAGSAFVQSYKEQMKLHQLIQASLMI